MFSCLFVYSDLSEKVEFFQFHERRTCFLRLGSKVAFLAKYLKATVKHQIPCNIAFGLCFALGSRSPDCSLSEFPYSATDF